MEKKIFILGKGVMKALDIVTLVVVPTRPECKHVAHD